MKLFTRSKTSLTKSTKIQNPKLRFRRARDFVLFRNFHRQRVFPFCHTTHNTQSENVRQQLTAHSSAPYKLPVRPFSLDRVTTRQVLLTLPFRTRAVGGKTPGFPGFALLASERRLREEGERGGREGGGVLGLNPTPSRSTRLDPIENFPINFFPKK